MKLNIGAGKTEIEGFHPVDRAFGEEAFPLQYEDNSVEEIRASHVLEHFGHREVDAVLKDWVRVLKPGGKIRIAVPDFNKIVEEHRLDPLFEGYLYGGQVDENDFHRSLWTEEKLIQAMRLAGLGEIQWWEDPTIEDCATLPVSLNLEGIKPEKPTPQDSSMDIKVAGLMTMGRMTLSASRNVIDSAFTFHSIPIRTSNGVFYGQCMQRLMEEAVADGVDVILTVDTDSFIREDHISLLLRRMLERDDIDCLAALEPRRNADRPLMTVGGATSVQTDGAPIKVTTAHFGLTAIRTENLVKCEKPWFFGQPDKEGRWTDDRLDPDIWFWHQWRLAGNTVWVDPKVRIGHLEEVVAYFDENLEYHTVTPAEWRKQKV